MTAPGCAWRLGGISLPRIKPSLWGQELSGPPSNLTPILLSVSPAGGSPLLTINSLFLSPPHNPSSCLLVLIPHPSIHLPSQVLSSISSTISSFHFWRQICSIGDFPFQAFSLDLSHLSFFLSFLFSFGLLPFPSPPSPFCYTYLSIVRQMLSHLYSPP